MFRWRTKLVNGSCVQDRMNLHTSRVTQGTRWCFASIQRVGLGYRLHCRSSCCWLCHCWLLFWAHPKAGSHKVVPKLPCEFVRFLSSPPLSVPPHGHVGWDAVVDFQRIWYSHDVVECMAHFLRVYGHDCMVHWNDPATARHHCLVEKGRLPVWHVCTP